MSLKHLVPPALRDRLRPTVQQLQRCGRSTVRQIVDSGWWPKPPEWRQLRGQLAQVNDPRELYAIAAREFGILQVEQEIVPFLEYVRDHQPKIVGEIGLKHGGNTFLFTRMFQTATQFIGLDLVLQNIGKARFLCRPGQQLAVIEGNSYAPEAITKVRYLLGSQRFDFLFIDGDHEYNGVKADFEGYFDLVRSGGLIAFHDIVPDEFARTGVRNPDSLCYGGGVHQLWKELREQFPHREFVNSWDQNGFGIGVLTKP
jgi:cephalosporin hydroxylase